MGTVIFARVWLTDVDGQERKIQIAIISVELVEGRDLAHERRSNDTAEFQQYMFLVAEVRKPDSLSLETRQLEV
jgi:hypothetical protein